IEHLIDDHCTVALGMNVADRVITYRIDKFATVQQLSVNRDVSYKRALEILGAIVNDPDLLPLHILPIKHQLVGLLSVWRFLLKASWDTPMVDELQECLSIWMELVRTSTLPQVPRFIDVTADMRVYSDASTVMQCYMVFQGSSK
ncbi:hypothetical protein FOZ62_017858, partial [Perkinsus olseni]